MAVLAITVAVTGRDALVGAAASNAPATASTTTTTNAPAVATPQSLSVTVSGSNGVGDIVEPGLPCASGGQGNYRDYLLGTTIPGGVLSGLAGTLRANLDVQHDGTEPPVGPVTTKAFLLGNASHATITNQRGTLQMELTSGTCGTPTLPFDGTTVGPGSGTWTIDPTSPGNGGSYRQASGSGTFNLTAAVAPGADNPWSLNLKGSVSVLEPGLTVAVANVFWGNLGLDYAARKVSVTYQITNSGPGDAFGVTLAATSSSSQGVSPLGPTPQALGDIASGASTTATVVYQLGLLAPCAAVILGCKFTTTVTATVPDALDVPSTLTGSNQVTAPALPPPL